MNGYIVAGIVAFGIIIICALAFRRSPSEDSGVDEMSGTEFEEFMADVLYRSGIEVIELTKKSGDFGADIIIMYEGERTAVQCKRYMRPIGVKAVQEAVSSMSYYKCTRSAVITNSTFTRQAEELAAENGVILWDGEDVRQFMTLAETRGIKNQKRKAYGTLRFHREITDESHAYVYINKEEYLLLNHKTTVITVAAGECRIIFKEKNKKAVLDIILSEETRNFYVGIHKNKPVLAEIS